MTDCRQTEWAFPTVKSRKVTVDFSGGDITSNADVLLLRQADRIDEGGGWFDAR